MELYDITVADRAVTKLDIDHCVSRVMGLRGGTPEAKKHLQEFIFKHEALSPFGQISPLYIAMRILESGSRGKEAYPEELLVRRELSVNFVTYNQDYDFFMVFQHGRSVLYWST